MMRFGRMTLTLLILFAPCVVLARLVGSVLPESPVTFFFLDKDGTPCPAPCVLGIRPGETVVGQVATTLAKHPLADNSRPVDVLKDTYLFTANGNTMSLAYSTEAGGEVNYVRLSFVERVEVRKSRSPTLGDIIRVFGTPDFVIDCSVPVLNCSCGLIFVFLDAGLEVFVPRREPIADRLSYDYSLSDFVVFRPGRCPPSALETPTLPWTGFTAVSRYTQEGSVTVFYQDTNRIFPIVCIAPLALT